MAYTLFISDLHLRAERPDITRALARFLEHHSGKTAALYILGDLFEAWVGDDDDSEVAAQVTDLLRHFDSPLYLMHGNRDFLIAATFCQRSGAQLLADPTVIDLYGTPTLLMHGDSLCVDDRDYQIFRQQTRNAAWQDSFLANSLEQRRAAATQMRSQSMEANSNKAADIMDVNVAEVEREMRSAAVTQLIHGHTHRPDSHTHTAGRRWVLGDWDQQYWAIRASESNIELYNVPINQ